MSTSSRSLDPQLHTHFVLFNCTWDQSEQRWKALQTSAMFDAIHYGTEVYRNELAGRLYQLGYSLRRTASAFEIEGVSAQLIERFSKRAKQRDVGVARAEQRLGRKLSKDEIAHVVHQTRPQKLKGVSDARVREQQLGCGDALRILEQCSQYRFGELTTIRRQQPEAFRQAVELAAAKKT
jgi:conjugative relaxase-like TrwC/TraI family protein